ncbi:MAG TPA: hypothetical protein VMC10_07785 [Stellaceae bacterium]|nr:hypothetical protein [Stellaceae bacterium]
MSAIGTSKRPLIAALIAPGAPVLMVVGTQFLGVARTDLRDGSNVFFLLIVLAGLYACSIVVGAPAYLFVRRLRLTEWYAYSAVSFVAGALALPLGLIADLAWIFLSAGAGDSFRAASIYATLNGKIGAGCFLGGLIFIPIGLLFWFIERPDRSSK